VYGNGTEEIQRRLSEFEEICKGLREFEEK
jgi:hypothetical protein